MKKLKFFAILVTSLFSINSQLFGEEAPISVQLDPATVICQKFMGFGAEWDSNAYVESGVTDEDFAVIQKRVEWMRLPTARIMMLSKWCYKGNGQYDWNDPKMNALYRHLDVCEKLGTTVMLTDWGVERDWLAVPEVTRPDDLKYAEIVSTYMAYLLNVKKYTCIKYFILVNEPNLEVSDWARWKKGIENVSAAFNAKGLQGKVKLMGSDQSGNDQWHKDAVDQLQGTLGSYDIHHYATEELVRSGGLFEYYKSNWAYALANDPNARDKPLVAGEAGFISPGVNACNNPLNGEPRYAVAMSDYAVQATNAGSWSVVAWMLDDNSQLGFNWGMWKSHKDGLVTKPWFYTWSLLSRCFPAGSTIVSSKLNSSDVRVLAANWDANQSAGGRAWTFCIVNRADTPKTVRLNMNAGPLLSLNRYVFSATSSVVNEDGFPVALEKLNCDLGTGADIMCEANSVTFLSSIGDGVVTAQK